MSNPRWKEVCGANTDNHTPWREGKSNVEDKREREEKVIFREG